MRRTFRFAREKRCKPLGVHAFKSPAEVVENCDLVVISVKPYLVDEVLSPVREALREKAVISVAAGLLFDFYEDLLGEGSRHLSTIPNTPIAIGKGVISCEERHTLDVDEWETFVGLFLPHRAYRGASRASALRRERACRLWPCFRCHVP